MTIHDLSHLLAAPDVREDVVLASPVGLMAYHGGDLEVGTDQIATAVAEATGSSLYTVCQPEGMRWHLPSVRFRAEHSPNLTAFMGHVQLAVTVHGFGRRRMFRSILLGGGNRAAAATVGACLRRHLPDYEIIDRIDHIPVELRGLHRRNPVNVPPQRGVQIELPPRVRGNGPFWNSWPDGLPTPHTHRLVQGLVDAVQELTEALTAEPVPQPSVQGASRSRTQSPTSSRR